MAASSPRLLFYCQDGAGLGHVRRAITLAAHLGDVLLGAESLILTRSAANLGLFALPPRCDIVKLPSLAPLGPDAQGELRTLVDEEPPRYLRLRAALIRELVHEFRPHLVHVDNEPQGLGGELLPALAALRAECPETALVFGLRDIRGTGAHVRHSWSERNIYTTLDEHYRAILVYGERDVFDVAGEYGLRGVTYCGYLTPVRSCPDAAAWREERSISGATPVIAVTAGSGADGLLVMQAYLRALPLILGRVAVHTVMVTGPLMPSAHRDLLKAAAGGLLTLRETLDTYALMAAARVVVCRGGYNSVAEAIALGRIPLVIPRRTRSGEQALRAALFAERGWCRTLAEESLTPERLADEVVKLCEHGPAPVPPLFQPAQALDRIAAALRPLLADGHG